MEAQPIPNDNNGPYVAKINLQHSPPPPPPFILNGSTNLSGGRNGENSFKYHEYLQKFFGLTGSTILYCLSAASIVYGMWRLIGPVLAESNVFSRILPCILAMNVYELALLGVLAVLLVWRHVTDDAISLLILIAIFIIVSGLTLTTATPSGPDKCLLIGLLCAVVGIGKLFILRKWISIRIGIISFTGLSIILAWNFIIPSLLSKPFATGDWPDDLRRAQWMLSWLVLLSGAMLVLIETMRTNHPMMDQSEGTAFVHTHAMMRIFSLVLLAAACFHQHAMRFMFLVDGAFGDYLPCFAIFVLLILELMRSFPRRFARIETAIACVPLGLTLLAIGNKAIAVSFADASQWLFYPPVLLALNGLAVLWMGLAQRRQWFGMVAVCYTLGVLLTIGFSPGRPYDLNWRLCGGGLVSFLLILGIIRRNPWLCFTSVLLTAAGLGTIEKVTELVRMYGMIGSGAVAGMTGLGTMVIYLVFGTRTPRSMAIFGAVCIVVSFLDIIPAKSSLVVMDLPMGAGIFVLCGLLWLRTRDAVTIGILSIPVLPRVFMLVRTMAAWGWGFVVLSFVLLFLGAIISFFYKQNSPDQDIDSLELKGWK